MKNILHEAKDLIIDKFDKFLTAEQQPRDASWPS